MFSTSLDHLKFILARQLYYPLIWANGNLAKLLDYFEPDQTRTMFKIRI